MTQPAACRYAVVQFVPFPETGEFANVGVVLACPRTGYFGYRLEVRKTKRLTQFFAGLPRDSYLQAITMFRGELERVSQVFAIEVNGVEQRRQVFDALIHPREAILRFGALRFVLAQDPAQEIERLFRYYVHQDFVTPEYVELQLERRIKAVLKTLDLSEPFRSDVLGDENFRIRFPLIQKEKGVACKVIKPLNLAQAEPTAIYEHGDAWLQKVRRLRHRGHLPEQVLFTLAEPPESAVNRFSAFSEVQRELQANGVVTVSTADAQAVARFALA